MASPEAGVMAQTMPLGSEDPAELGSYTLLAKLGQGGMGTVYLGRSERGRLVAIKVIRADVADDPEFRIRFRVEAETARRVKRLCTAEVLDADPDAAQPYLVTEFIEGKTLAKWVSENGPLAGANLEQLAAAVAAALTAIHSAGIVHRDLKPANVVLSPFGPRVIDFGIARALDAATSLTGDLQQLGTPAFMSPEQIEGGKTITPAVDVWAWGGIVTYAATGHYPFGEGNAQVLLYRALYEDPHLDDLDEALRPIVWHAMRKDPAARPTAQQLMLRLLGESPSTPTEAAEREVTQVLQTWRLPAPSGPTGAAPYTGSRTGAPHTGSRTGDPHTGSRTGDPHTGPRTGDPHPGSRAGTAGPGTVTQSSTDLVGREAGGAPGGPPTPYPPTKRDRRRPPGKRRTGWVVGGVAVAVAAILASILVVLSRGSEGENTGGGGGTTAFALPEAAEALSDRTMVYASQREGGRYSLFTSRVDANGVLTDEKRITDDTVDTLLPAIVPGRKTVIYYRKGVPATLHAVAADGSGTPVQLFTSGPAAKLSIAQDARPSVSPDGRFLVVRSTTDATGALNPGLYVASLDGSSVRRLNAKPQATDPAWEPSSGEVIAYWSNETSGDGGFLVVIPAREGGQPTKLTPDDGSVLDADPAWSPDGSKIVFRRKDPATGRMDIFSMSPIPKAAAQQLTNVGGAQDPAFSPRLPGNTSQLIFTALRDGVSGDRELYLMRDLTKPDQIQQLTNRGGNDTHPRWGDG
jgi:serine/threonine protein kinase